MLLGLTSLTLLTQGRVLHSVLIIKNFINNNIDPITIFLMQVLPGDGGEREQAGDKRNSQGGRWRILLPSNYDDDDDGVDETS